MLYNQARPTKLSELLGQARVVKVVRGAIRKGLVPQCMVFVGPSGVGKTTVSRILARLLNCEVSQDDPCGECQACVDNSMAVYQEHDGGRLNRKEGEKHSPLDGVLDGLAFKTQRYKVVVFDEAHKLDEEAQGKLLKVTEEAPPGVVFVFNTTDISLLDLAIQNRAIILNFNRLPTDLIIEGLKAAVVIGGYAVEDPALLALALACEGSLRQAIKTLEQCWLVTPEGEPMTEAIVRETIGGAGEEEILKFLLRLKAKDAKDDLKGAFDAMLSSVAPHRLVARLFDVVTNVLRFQFQFVEGVDPAFHPLYGQVVRAYGQDVFKLIKAINDPMISRPVTVDNLYLAFLYTKSIFGGFTILDRRSQTKGGGPDLKDIRNIQYLPGVEAPKP